VGDLGAEAKRNEWPVDLKYALIGSCTNSSYEDMQRAATIAGQAANHGIKAKIGFMVTPGSEQIHKTIQRDGQLEIFNKIGGKRLRSLYRAMEQNRH
jgi:aconitate hydratase